MKDKQIKMVALDLDGTTLNRNKEISKRTLEAFDKAMKAGVHIVVSTGRAFQSLPKQLFTVDGMEYVITSNGAHITDLASMETVYENHIAPRAVEEVVAALRKGGFSVETFVEGVAYIDREEYDLIFSGGLSFRDREYVISTRNPVPQILDFILLNKERIENISINFEHAGDREVIEGLMGKIEGITLTSSFHHNFEIGGATTSKGEALRFLMDKLGVTAQQLMACGDSPNDGEMIKLAEVGVVMGNASEQMKAMADFVTDTNDNDGVAKAIEKFVL